MDRNRESDKARERRRMASWLSYHGSRMKAMNPYELIQSWTTLDRFAAGSFNEATRELRIHLRVVRENILRELEKRVKNAKRTRKK